MTFVTRRSVSRRDSPGFLRLVHSAYPNPARQHVGPLWPIVTLALILVDLVIFAATHRFVEEQDSRVWEVQEHILVR